MEERGSYKNEQKKNTQRHKPNPTWWKREGRKNEQTMNAHRHKPKST